MTAAPDKLPGQRFEQRIVHHLLAFIFRLFFRLYGRWQVLGLENVPKTGGVLFAANHASYLDPPLGWAAMYGTRKLWGVARDDLWKNKVIGYLLDCIGVFPVKRHSADRAMIRRVLEVLARGDTVGIFPEGLRTHDGLLNPAEPGIALLVQKANVPLIPVALIGTYEMLSRHQKKLKRARIKVIVGVPMTFAPDTPRDVITTQLMEAIAALMTAHGCSTEPPGPERAALLAANEAASEARKKAKNATELESRS